MGPVRFWGFILACLLRYGLDGGPFKDFEGALLSWEVVRFLANEGVYPPSRRAFSKGGRGHAQRGEFKAFPSGSP